MKGSKLEANINEPIVRISAPDKYCQLPYKTKCVVMKNDRIIEVYLQMSQDELDPNWELVEEIPEE